MEIVFVTFRMLLKLTLIYAYIFISFLSTLGFRRKSLRKQC